jgi:hypothetical protein
MNKTEFQEILGRQICDQTWYRVNAKFRSKGLRKNKDFNEYKTALTLLAEMSKKSERNINYTAFFIAWGLLKKGFNKLPETLIGSDLKQYLTDSLPIKPSQSVFYRWFQSAGCPFRDSDEYTRKEIITVTALAHSWLNKKTPKSQPSENLLADYKPLSEILETSKQN